MAASSKYYKVWIRSGQAGATGSPLDTNAAEGPFNMSTKVVPVRVLRLASNDHVIFHATTTTGSKLVMQRSTNGGVSFSGMSVVEDIGSINVQDIGAVSLSSTNWVVVYSYNVVSTGNVGMRVLRTFDAGVSWTATQLFSPVSGSGFADSVDLVQLSSTNILLAYSGEPAAAWSATIVSRVSSNGGSTWASPVTVDTSSLPYGFDSFSVSASSSTIVHLAAIRVNQSASTTDTTCRIYRSTNGGTTWTNTTNFASSLLRPSIYANGSTVFVSHCRLTNTSTSLFASAITAHRSTDSGVSWSAGTDIYGNATNQSATGESAIFDLGGGQSGHLFMENTTGPYGTGSSGARYIVYDWNSSAQASFRVLSSLISGAIGGARIVYTDPSLGSILTVWVEPPADGSSFLRKVLQAVPIGANSTLTFSWTEIKSYTGMAMKQGWNHGDELVLDVATKDDNLRSKFLANAVVRVTRKDSTDGNDGTKVLETFLMDPGGDDKSLFLGDPVIWNLRCAGAMERLSKAIVLLAQDANKNIAAASGTLSQLLDRYFDSTTVDAITGKREGINQRSSGSVVKGTVDTSPTYTVKATDEPLLQHLSDLISLGDGVTRFPWRMVVDFDTNSIPRVNVYKPDSGSYPRPSGGTGIKTTDPFVVSDEARIVDELTEAVSVNTSDERDRVINAVTVRYGGTGTGMVGAETAETTDASSIAVFGRREKKIIAPWIQSDATGVLLRNTALTVYAGTPGGQAVGIRRAQVVLKSGDIYASSFNAVLGDTVGIRYRDGSTFTGKFLNWTYDQSSETLQLEIGLPVAGIKADPVAMVARLEQRVSNLRTSIPDSVASPSGSGGSSVSLGPSSFLEAIVSNVGYDANVHQGLCVVPIITMTTAGPTTFQVTCYTDFVNSAGDRTVDTGRFFSNSTVVYAGVGSTFLNVFVSSALMKVGNLPKANRVKVRFTNVTGSAATVSLTAYVNPLVTPQV